MRVAACYVVHYGSEWLYHSMRSVCDFADPHVFYTSRPSFGHGTNLVCPDSRDTLRLIAGRFDGMSWTDCGPFRHEGEHRTFAVETLGERGYDLVVVVDADEVWDPAVLYDSLKMVEATDYRAYRIGMRHFWRSLKWVCDDPATPTRFIKPHHPITDESYLPGKVYHMGYAQTPAMIAYKQDIHGHKGEWRQGWFENTFMPWMPGKGDVHPTCVNFWNPQPFVDEDGTLEYLVGDHPFWGKDLIV